MTYTTFEAMTKELTNSDILKIVNTHLAHKEQQREYHKAYNARKNERWNETKGMKEVRNEEGRLVGYSY